MATEIRLHFEGDSKLLPGFRTFFGEFHHSGTHLTLVPCGANGVDKFMDGLKEHPNAVNILLIDSEGSYTPGLLREVRQHDHWDAGAGAQVTDAQINFMVQLMESWFLADRQALRAYYGQSFLENRLPGNQLVEQVPKDDVLNGLAITTASSSKGKYHKTRHAPDLLARIDPSKVRDAAPNCARLFDYLQNLVSPPNNPQGGVQ